MKKSMMILALPLFLFSITSFASNNRICSDLNKSFTESKSHPENRTQFLKLIRTLKLATKKADGIRSCKNQLDTNITYVRDSRFPEGRAFIQSKSFQATLDGASAELFKDGGTGESAFIPPLRVSKPNGKPIFWSTDYRCVTITKDQGGFGASFILNDYAKARFYEFTQKELNQKIAVSICSGKPKEIKVSAPIPSGRIFIDRLSAEEIQCLKDEPSCK